MKTFPFKKKYMIQEKLNEYAKLQIEKALSYSEGMRQGYIQAKSEWVGLTDEDMNNALDYWSDDSRSAYGGAHSANGEYVDMIETWRYIEAKLKEKNT
jgi:hypothetical protein